MSISPAFVNLRSWLRPAIFIAAALQLPACNSAGSDKSVQVVHNPPITIGPEGTEPIAFKRVVVDIPTGTTVGFHYGGVFKLKNDEHYWGGDAGNSNSQLVFAAAAELRRLGYSVLGNEKDPFSDVEASHARFLLGAKILKMTYDTYDMAAGDCCLSKLDVEWQVYDTSVGKVVLSTPSVGGARLDGCYSPAVKAAFVSSLGDLTSNETFVSMVRKGAAVDTPAPSSK
jgi:hypothetical protein